MIIFIVDLFWSHCKQTFHTTPQRLNIRPLTFIFVLSKAFQSPEKRTQFQFERRWTRKKHSSILIRLILYLHGWKIARDFLDQVRRGGCRKQIDLFIALLFCVVCARPVFLFHHVLPCDRDQPRDKMVNSLLICSYIWLCVYAVYV